MAIAIFTTRDRNRYKKVYPFVRVPPILGPFLAANSVGADVVYLETGKVTFTNALSGSYTFITPYSTSPIVVATSVDSLGNDGANVNIFVQSVSTTSVTFGSSNAFTGEVHFHVAALT